MAITDFTAGETLLADQLDTIREHLEGQSGSTLAWFLRVLASNDFIIQLSDAGGVQKLSIQDSAGTEVAKLDSDGNFQIDGTLNVDGASTLTGNVTLAGSVDTITVTGTITAGSSAIVLTTAAGRLTHEAGGLEFDASAVTTGGIIQGASSGAMELLTIGNTDDVLTVAGGKAAWTATDIPTFLDKTAIQTVNASTTLVSDTHMTFTAVANKNYWIEIQLLTTAASTTPNLDIQVDVPGTSTFDGIWSSSLTGPASTSGNIVENAEETIDLAAQTDMVHVVGLLITDGTGGTVTLKWAQNVSDASNVSLEAGSALMYLQMN